MRTLLLSLTLLALTVGCRSGNKTPDDQSAETDTDADARDSGAPSTVDDDNDGINAAEDCDDQSVALGSVWDDGDCDGMLRADDCRDDDAESTTRATDADCDGTVTEDDCDDTNPDSTTVAIDADCDAVLTDDDCYDDDPTVGVECPLVNCKDRFDDDPSLVNGLYELSVPGFDPFEAYCDMDGGGWTLAYLASVDAGYSPGEMIAGPGELGDVAPTPDETGDWKLHDEKINALRSGGVTNDIRVRAFAGGSLVGDSWHPSSCSITWNTGTSDADCLQSTRSGPSATDYTTSGHDGALTRWYVDGSFGYMLPHTHLGPVSGGHSHGSSLPNFYCTFYDRRTCPQPSKFHVWIY